MGRKEDDETSGPEWMEIDRLRADLAASQREVKRLRHGEATAEDGVCPDVVEVVRLREEVTRLQGDRCDVCDEDGLIYIYTSDLCDVGEWEDSERPEVCPACGGTRSGFASRMRSEVGRCRELIIALVENACEVDAIPLDAVPLDSCGMSTNADALRYLAEIGRVEIVSEHGRRVIARWKP